MSSHHIVRDEQEPALIILDEISIHQYESGSAMEDIGQLLEWSPTVIGMEDSLESLLTLGIKIDIAVITEESIPIWTEKLAFQQPIKYLSSSKEFLKALTETVKFLITENHKTFHLFGRKLTLFDFIAFFQMFSGKAELIYINESRKISISNTGNYYKWLNKGEIVSVFPIEEPTYIRTMGFVENPDNVILNSEFNFEVQAEGPVKIETNLKPLIISETL